MDTFLTNYFKVGSVITYHHKLGMLLHKYCNKEGKYIKLLWLYKECCLNNNIPYEVSLIISKIAINKLSEYIQKGSQLTFYYMFLHAYPTKYSVAYENMGADNKGNTYMEIQKFHIKN